jgi:hypothetical protein
MATVVMGQANPNIVSARDALKYLGSFVVFISAWAFFYFGFTGWFADPKEQLTHVIVSMIGGFIGVTLLVFYILDFFYKKSVNYGTLTIISLGLVVILFFISEPNSVLQNNLNTWAGVALGGILIMFVALRPNFGPEANKRIYQASSAIFAFIVAIIILILGIYIYTPPRNLAGDPLFGLDIGDFAGTGRYPGNFINDYVYLITDGIPQRLYENIKGAGLYIMIGAMIIIAMAFVRNKITLLIASIGIVGGTGLALYGVGVFNTNWDALDDYYYDNFNRALELGLNDPGISSIVLILCILEIIAAGLMLYAAFAAKPIEQWRRRRDQCIAAAEVATREGRLPQAVKYLEAAAMWSSKIDEEDKSIELLTRVKQIRDKAIKMKKAQAAEKAKKDYDKQQKAAKVKEVKKAPPKAKEVDEKDSAKAAGPGPAKKID